MKLLVASLTSLPKFDIVDDSEIIALLKKRHYEEPDVGQSNGFYDYLRSAPGAIIGVRWVPFSHAEYVLESVKLSPLLEARSIGTGRALIIKFGVDSTFDNAISDDQWFWWNRIFKNTDTAEMAVTFGLSDLAQNEVDGIEERISTLKTD